MAIPQPIQAHADQVALARGVGPVVSLRDVTHVYGRGDDRVVALDGISLDVHDGEFVSVVGASGCGKSTLLSLVAGLETPTAGSVAVRGARPAMVFQEHALFPWLTVERNVALAMRFRGVPRVERIREARRLLELVHLGGVEGKRPHELSGGMRQRAAIARALAQSSDVLLMDEPFAAVDAITRDVLHEELVRIWQQTGVTVLFVTHNVREAVRLGQRVVLLTSRPGRVASEFAVDIAGPRRIESPDVAALSIEITRHLRAEIQRHGTG